MSGNICRCALSGDPRSHSRAADYVATNENEGVSRERSRAYKIARRRFLKSGTVPAGGFMLGTHGCLIARQPRVRQRAYPVLSSILELTISLR